jgi:hypothetical protein
VVDDQDSIGRPSPTVAASVQGLQRLARPRNFFSTGTFLPPRVSPLLTAGGFTGQCYVEALLDTAHKRPYVPLASMQFVSYIVEFGKSTTPRNSIFGRTGKITPHISFPFSIFGRGHIGFSERSCYKESGKYGIVVEK